MWATGLELRLVRSHDRNVATRNPIARPPTVPPAIAPILEVEFDVDPSVVDVDIDASDDDDDVDADVDDNEVKVKDAESVGVASAIQEILLFKHSTYTSILVRRTGETRRSSNVESIFG